MLDDEYPPQPPVSTGLAGRCPRCGEGKLFAGFLTLAPSCPHCGLDYKFADTGDGPAIFVMLIGGFIVVGGALLFDFAYEPPWWTHLLVTLPLALAVCLGILRGLKGVLIALQYSNKAELGRLDQP